MSQAIVKRKVAAMRRSLFTRQGGICYLCGGPMELYAVNGRTVDMATFDHLLPVADGGSDDESNLRMAHQGCNSIRDRLNIVGVPLALPMTRLVTHRSKERV